jgi:hypothetical protein
MRKLLCLALLPLIIGNSASANTLSTVDLLMRALMNQLYSGPQSRDYTFRGAMIDPDKHAPCPNGSLANNPNLEVLMQLQAIYCQVSYNFGFDPGSGCNIIVGSPTYPDVCMIDGTANNLTNQQCKGLGATCNVIWPGTGHCTGSC